MSAPPGIIDGSGIYLTGEDNLRLTTYGAITGADVALEGRFITPDGRIVPFAERQTPTTDRTAKTTVFQTGEGVLTNVHLRATAGSVLGGGVFAVLEIVRGREGNVQPLGTLLQGYVTSNARLAWPGSPILPSTAGVGRLRVITGTDPAAGVEISETVPAGVRWRLLALRVALVTDATVANRVTTLTADDGATEYFRTATGQNETASSTFLINVGVVGAFGNGLAGVVFAPWPEYLTLGAGHRLRTVTSGLVAGDNYGAPVYAVEEFIE